MISDVFYQEWINIRTLHALHKLINILSTDITQLFHVQNWTQKVWVVFLFFLEDFFVREKIFDYTHKLKLKQN